MQMGDIEPCDESAFEAVDQKSCKNILFEGNLIVAEDHFNCSNKEIVELDLLMEKLEISDEDDLNDLLFEEHETVHVKETICSSISNKETLQFSSPKTSKFNDLGKCAPILCSEALESCPSICASAESSIIELGSESSVAVSTPAKDSLMPYHDSSKCMSALKGSRARQGKPLEPNLHVTWAADVYDPPVTSSSHTVKGHRHRLPKAKTSDHQKHKHKHMKTKPSSDRKHSHRSSSSSLSDQRYVRFQALARRSWQSGFTLAYLRALDIPVSSRRDSSNCGSNFQAKSPWRPPSQSIAEAS
ncbi:uncharacterized protein LOC110026965 [Phalaenopsis equestris]|uniref:uncharacterized protein LOC110026965 n=1 Tax=Phalaenopsis equestris TaxID=78828 RepID=UPI0009E43ED8|nr:uncharacterized protein LOC110026965 [Phalaenopsis equestris]